MSGTQKIVFYLYDESIFNVQTNGRHDYVTKILVSLPLTVIKTCFFVTYVDLKKGVEPQPFKSAMIYVKNNKE
ncbi:hypothetical protein Lal_00031055 [Lupinus albus]|nr:hypothetical protein Lal_00031055 [Lupinus albus]